MGLSRLSKICRNCRYVDACNHKRMEALASIDAGVGAAAPMIEPHDYREIKIGFNTTVTIDLEELKKKLEESIYPSLFECGG